MLSPKACMAAEWWAGVQRIILTHDLIFYVREPSRMSKSPRWLIMIHQLPPKPAYARVKVHRRLQQLGAVPVKQTVYALCNTNEALEDFQWLRKEIESLGGNAIIATADFLAGVSNKDLEPAEKSRRRSRSASVAPGSTWVTRRGVEIDRMASAWLIRRFIDSDADFKFVDERKYRSSPGALRFDMADAEYTHEGDRCTFETLLRRFDIRRGSLQHIGEIVHDLDLKDGKFGRPERRAVSTAMNRIIRAGRADDVRLARAFEYLDTFHARLSGP